MGKREKQQHTTQQIVRWRARLMRTCPTHAIADAVIYQAAEWPVPGMVRCLTCGRHYPAYYVSGGRCTDCRYEGMTDHEIEGLPGTNWLARTGREA
jgi:hypothetical protein